MNDYVSIQGDFWDLAAMRAYGVEAGQFLMSDLIAANYDKREIEQFGGGIVIRIPEPQVVTTIELVPWKAANVEVWTVPAARAPIYLGGFPSRADLPRVDGVNVRPGDLAYIRKEGEFVEAIGGTR